MKAVVWHGRRDVRVDTVPDPTIEEPTDAIVRITSTGLCGSDLHLYEVMAPFMTEGDILGHEPMGIVEAVGSEVHPHRAGRPGGDPVQHLLRSLRDVLRRVCSRSARRRRSASTTRAPRCSATPSCTGRCRAARPSCCGCRRRSTARSRCPTVRPTTGSCTSPTCCPTAWQAVQYADDPGRRHRRRARPRTDRIDGVPRSPPTSARRR